MADRYRSRAHRRLSPADPPDRKTRDSLRCGNRFGDSPHWRWLSAVVVRALADSGSMFVFRLIIYFYDRSHETTPPRLSQTLGYFFLLPNVCFPLFPVVDFKKFCRHYYDGDRHKIYQVGIEWIWRGLLQLVLYRIIYYHFTLDPVAVADRGDLAFYMLSTFLLYVRISGQFHLVIGMLHLFGFNLPETHHRYLLASSFTDFWRRINIYWKDFMMKVFYYPAFFRFRRLGDTKALVLATVFTFLMTWFLHFVQWFWIRGSLLIELNDVIFWTVFALLVLVNSLYEARHGRARILARTRTVARERRTRPPHDRHILRHLRAVVVLDRRIGHRLVADGALVLDATTVDVTAIRAGRCGAGGRRPRSVYIVWKGWGAADQRPVVRYLRRPCWRPRPPCACSPFRRSLSHWPPCIRRLAAVRLAQPPRRRGVSARLLREPPRCGPIQRGTAADYERMPKDFVRSLSVLGLSRRTGDEQDFELVPNKEGRFVGAMVRTNHWGMRDREYSLEPPAGVYRIALLGPSTAMGSGVEAHESFEALVEERLNRSARQTARPASRF